MTNFVNTYIDNILAESSESDPTIIATDVLDRIDDEGLTYEALQTVLPSYVRGYLQSRRTIPVERPEITNDTVKVEFEYDLTDDEATPKIKSTSSARSARVAVVRNDWLRQLQTPLYVGTEWKRLAECTSEDLLLVATDLRTKAAANLTKASYYESLAAAIPAGKVLGDLSESPVAVNLI